MRLPFLRPLTALAALLTLGGALAGQNAYASTAEEAYAAIPRSLKPTTDVDLGEFSSSKMTIEVALAPRNESELADLLTQVYDSKSPSYQEWLATGEFNTRFAPSSAQIAAIIAHLQSKGLVVEQSPSPFLVRASGPSSVVAAAFKTTLHSYRNARGVTYFSNVSEVQVPVRLAAGVLGVIGLSNTVRPQSHAVRRRTAVEPLVVDGSHSGGKPSCETGYVTEAQLFNLVNNGVGYPYGYGGGPGCSGLTPSQINSFYGAHDTRGAGRGVTAAVFELSAYQESDIATWASTFYGPGYSPPLTNIIIDGGPLNPVCPTGDQCPPAYNGYAGDIEVDADIEMELSIAPDLKSLIVYNAPNDYTGQTELDEYTAIADQNVASTVSSSWAVCENDLTAAYVQAENVVFEQMALQGQSMFSSSGDTGAFECIRSDGTTIVNVLDPSAQPWVTGVGGTSFENDNPDANPNPQYPRAGESVWNVDGLCNTSASEGGQPGFFWCAYVGAGGGGNSQYWGRPWYQHGPGIPAAGATRGNGTTQCALAPVGTYCREVPDVSANADPYTGYAEYCTGSASTPYSACATFSGGENPPGWFGIGGTSLSSPLWGALIAVRNGETQHRTGSANVLAYLLYNLDPGYSWFFHDVTQGTNGLNPATPGYDLASGIGTPVIPAIAGGF
jgi:subtilase family serine protease